MQNKEGIKSLASEQKKYNDELERTQTLNRLMQAGTPLFGDSFREQAESYTQSLDRQKKAIKNLTGDYDSLVKEIQFLFKTEKEIPDSIKTQVNSIINSNTTIEEKTQALLAYARSLATHTQTSNRMLNNLRITAEKSLEDLEDANENRVVQMQAMNKS